MSQPIEITDTSFDAEVLGADTPVLVDYWAEWCGPCKAVGPAVEALASDYGDRLKVAKLDIDANADTPARFGIRSIPTLMLFHNGEILGTQVGAVSQGQLAAFVDAHLSA